ncbi:hypothetical protein VTI74DRAFT_956 [Chaetomium olivicolor]
MPISPEPHPQTWERDDGPCRTVEDDDDVVRELCNSCRSYLCSDTSWPTQAIREGFQKVVSSSATDGPQMPHLAESYCISTPRALSPQITFLDGSQNPKNPGSDQDLRSESGTNIEDVDICLDGNQASLLLPKDPGYNTLEFGTNYTNEAAIPKAIYSQEYIEMFSIQSKGDCRSKRKRSWIRMSKATLGFWAKELVSRAPAKPKAILYCGEAVSPEFTRYLS